MDNGEAKVPFIESIGTMVYECVVAFLLTESSHFELKPPNISQPES